MKRAEPAGYLDLVQLTLLTEPVAREARRSHADVVLVGEAAMFVHGYPLRCSTAKFLSTRRLRSTPARAEATTRSAKDEWRALDVATIAGGTLYFGFHVRVAKREHLALLYLTERSSLAEYAFALLVTSPGFDVDLGYKAAARHLGRYAAEDFFDRVAYARFRAARAST